MDLTKTKTAKIYTLSDESRAIFQHVIQEPILPEHTHIVFKEDGYYLMTAVEWDVMRKDMPAFTLPRFVLISAYTVEYVE